MTEFPATSDAVVIGGGVIGLAVARALATRGLRKIIVVERATLGAESSSAAAGMLAPQAEADSPDDFFYLTCQSRDLYPSFAAELSDETGIDVELDTTGTLYLAFDEQDAAKLQERLEWQSSAGLACELLSTEEARQLEPSISKDVWMALKFPNDTQVENRRLISALAAANERMGVLLAKGTKVNSLQSKRGRLYGVETSRGFISTENVVIAGGAWSSDLTLNDQPPSDKALPGLRIEPVRGQMICFEANPQVVRHVIYSHGGYIVPRRDGRLLAGSTTEYAGFDRRVTAGGMQSISSAALEICPAIGSLPLSDSWAGLRPRAADGLPVLGPCAEIAGVFYATGHYRNGILLAPLTANLLAEAIIDKVISQPLETFSPDRFSRVSV
ncbi:MAG TPA: glycine oxidase ThiO [Pyrinomonadaceae bacterium]|nr:glycine oxidase ThiO [Pyrinomonadaceae bacterium]